MRFYRVSTYGDTGTVRFVSTFADIKPVVRALLDERVPSMDIVVREVEIPTDKAGVQRLLNEDPGSFELPALRTWEVTDRGGLKETKE